MIKEAYHMRPKFWNRTLAGILAFTLVFGNVPLAGAEPLIDRIAITASADAVSPDPTTRTLEPVSATYNGESIELVTVPKALKDVQIGYSLGVPGDHSEETANKLTQLATMYSEQIKQHDQTESPDQNKISLFESLENAAGSLYSIAAGVYPSKNESYMEDATSDITKVHKCLDQMEAAQQETYARYLDKLYAALPGSKESLTDLEASRPRSPSSSCSRSRRPRTRANIPSTMPPSAKMPGTTPSPMRRTAMARSFPRSNRQSSRSSLSRRPTPARRPTS